MYIVHVKRITASEARRNWFRLLDEVAAGETVVIERNGRRIVLQRQADRVSEAALDYSAVIRAPGGADADAWGWTWSEKGSVRPTRRRTR